MEEDMEEKQGKILVFQAHYAKIGSSAATLRSGLKVERSPSLG
jgi:hypothetical protein